jgi:hypothetical protein
MTFRVFWDVAPCSHPVVLMIEAVLPSETSVNFNVSTSQRTVNFEVLVLSKKKRTLIHLLS